MNEANSPHAKSGRRPGSGTRLFLPLLGSLFFLLLAFGQARAEWPRVALSKDGTPISYEVHGAGEPTLVFVHGWSCDGRYWREQIPHFAKGHRVVVLDLAGHGHSGLARTRYTMAAFGEDVQGEMILPQTDPQLREWIIADVSAAPPAVALSAMTEMMTQYVTGDAARIFEQLRIPVITVKGDLWPVNFEANRRHMFSYQAIVLEKADHFLMMDRPDEFNRELEKAIRMLSEK
ncbi:MAG: alpha/beta fold hydrolase [Desulfobulbaceae bacterium]